MTVPTITVTGTYTTLANQPATGQVLFAAATPVENQADQLIVSTVPVAAVLDDDGSISIILPCTDTAGLSPLNFWYRVIEQITGYVREYAIQLPHTLGATVDLSALATSTSPPAISAFATSNTFTASRASPPQAAIT